MSDFINEVTWNHHGLVPAVAYDNISGQVVMLAYMNEESLKKTVETGYAHYFSRSRQELWKKGETSGHLQKVKAIKLDCDGDAILLEIEQEGAACHTGNKTCFFRELKDGQWGDAAENTSIARGMALEYNIIRERGNILSMALTPTTFWKKVSIKFVKKSGRNLQKWSSRQKIVLRRN